VDAIAVGSGTILADDPILTARGVCRERPLVRVIFDGRLRTPRHAKVLSTLGAGPVIIVTSAAAVGQQPETAAALRAAGASLQIHEAVNGGRPPLVTALERLASDGVSSIVVEGGPTLHRAAWDEGIVDRVQIFVTPQVVGASGLPWLPYESFKMSDLAHMTVEPIGDDVLVEGLVREHETFENLVPNNVHRPD
jgi:diaminohydroxyphosphoribosylaminopyrimidine deaminase / 5-amino-6-(5-phosphoribosylamino)uracil reductase